MEELYHAIEKKITEAGYPRSISGEAVYNDICDQIDGKENGSYVLYNTNAKNIIEDSFDLEEVTEGTFIKDLVSRKKQMLPKLMESFERNN